MEIVSSFLVEKALEATLEASRAFLKRLRLHVSSNPQDIAAAINTHVKDVEVWSSEVSFTDLRKGKQLRRVYLNLDCYLSPRRTRMSPTEEIPQISFRRLFAKPGAHSVILGTPGAGKTTSMKHLCQRVIHDEKFCQTYKIPIVLKCREFSRTQKPESRASTLFHELAATLGIQVHETDSKAVSMERDPASMEKLYLQIISEILENLGVILIVEGLDELPFNDDRLKVLQEVGLLTKRLSKAAVVLTSRTGEFTAHIENASIYELCPLEPAQILQFAEKWLGSEDKAQMFLDQLNATPFADSAVKPLTLAHLCAVYERIGSIPNKPKTVYRKILHLALEDWDEQRLVRRSSRYSTFSADRKYEFLANLSYELTTHGGGLIFNVRTIENMYSRIHQNFGLPLAECREVAQELEGHTGLFVQSGFESFEFAHKSLQEFLTAEFIVRLPGLPENLDAFIAALPNELAIAVAISSNSSLYLAELVFKQFSVVASDDHFFLTFASRIVQERPDFASDTRTVLALLSLYSGVVVASYRDQVRELILVESVLEELENMIASVMMLNDDLSLSSLYEFRGESHISDKLYWLERMIPKFMDLELSETLNMRKNFFSKNRTFLERAPGE